ncbi:MAG: hypothetical protein AAFV53_41385, partial [Myxococcota bacterium]
IVFEAQLSDAEESAEALNVTVTSNVQSGTILEGAPSSAGQFSGASVLDPGDHLLTFTATDSYGRTAQDTVSLEIYAHAPPDIDSVTITPTPADTAADLIATVNGWQDPDNSTPRNRYRWFKEDESGDMVEDINETTATYPSGKTTRGDRYQVEVTPFNEYGDGPTLRSGTVDIINSLPTAPLVLVDPSAPEITESLVCFASDSQDADNDTVTYTYSWLVNGADAGILSNVVSPEQTALGDVWECVVTPNDGIADGPSSSDVVTIRDTVAPDAPQLDRPTAYRNEADVTLTGTCEPGCVLTMYCQDDDITWTDTFDCPGGGAFSYETALTAGNTTSCAAECEDEAGNVSDLSSSVQTEVCDPGDEYEDDGDYGDNGDNAIAEWSAIEDDGDLTDTITIEANILSDDEEDWYLISASDDVSEDRSEGIDYFRFAVDMVDGVSTYEMFVYTGSPDAADRECSTGATEYSDFQEDKVHSLSETRACADGSAINNQCEDNSEDYYIQIVRLSDTVSSCQGYELEITNGVWE